MNESVENTEQKAYHFICYSASKRFNLKITQRLFAPYPVEQRGSDCLICSPAEDQRIFLFPFGTVVFFNIPVDERSRYLAALDIPIITQSLAEANTEKEVSQEILILYLGEGPLSVSGDAVFSPDLRPDLLLLIALVLSVSSVLDLITWEVEDLLERLHQRITTLKTGSLVRCSRRSLLRFLGEALSIRRRTVTHLAYVNTPDIIWDTHELSECYALLIDSYEIEQRIVAVEKMIELTADAGRLLLEIADTRRSEILEIIIILLIAVEIVQSLLSNI